MDNPDPRVYVVDGKPLKSILKRPKTSKITTCDSKQHGTNVKASTIKEDAEVAVRRKVAIAHDESNSVWEFNKNDFVSPSRNVKVVESVMCNKPSQEVVESTNKEDPNYMSVVDKLETHISEPMTCEGCKKASKADVPMATIFNQMQMKSIVHAGNTHVEPEMIKRANF
nr:hypothetical protein [Tanacetum cinerariifolium]